MSLTAILTMTVYLLVVWGLLAVASRHLAATDDESCGTLGSTDLDSLPMYTGVGKQQ